jgi:hypothetical protein
MRKTNSTPSLTLTASLLLAARRGTSEIAIRRLRDAFERLAGTRITNITTGQLKTLLRIHRWLWFDRGLGRSCGVRVRGVVSVKITLSECFRRSVSKSVLTLSRNYFSLRRPLGVAFTHWRTSIAARSQRQRAQAFLLFTEVRVNKVRAVSFRAMLREIIADVTTVSFRRDAC